MCAVVDEGGRGDALACGRMGLLLLVRHGQASFGADDYDVLSPAGWEQGRALGADLAARGIVPTALLRGDMRRHRETLEAMLEGAAGAPEWDPAGAEVDAGWDEFDHLAVVAADPGVPHAELDRRAFQAAFERATARWCAGTHDAEYDESWPAFLGRVRGSLGRATARAGSGEVVVAVTSGGPVAAAVATLVGGAGDGDAALTAHLWSRFNTVVVNSGVTRIVVGSTGPRLLSFNEHPHLAGDLLTYR